MFWCLSYEYPKAFKRRGRAGRVVQVVECLSSKHEALSLNPKTTKNKKEEVEQLQNFTSDLLVALVSLVDNLSGAMVCQDRFLDEILVV
jgi:hypothetical protein